MTTVHLKKDEKTGAWLGTITDGNKVVTGTAIDAEQAEYNKLTDFDAAVAFIRGTRPSYAYAEFVEIK